MAKLKSETNTLVIEQRIMMAAIRGVQWVGNHHHIDVSFGHGQWWVSCRDCGAQWSVVDQEGGGDIDGFGFEQVSEGDESCAGS